MHHLTSPSNPRVLHQHIIYQTEAAHTYILPKQKDHMHNGITISPLHENRLNKSTTTYTCSSTPHSMKNNAVEVGVGAPGSGRMGNGNNQGHFL